MTRIQSRDVVYFPFTPAYHFHLGLMMKKNQRMTEPIRYLAYLAMKRDREDNAEVYLQPLGNASAAVDYLLNGQADIAVVSTKELSNSLLSFIPLRDEELKLVLPFGHPAIHSFLRNGIHFDALEQDFFVLHQEGSFLHHEEMNIFRKASFSPSNFCEVSETEVALSMVENRKGVAFIPASQLEEGKGIAFSLAPEEIYHIAVAYRKDTMLTGALREFSMLLLENYDAYAG